MQRGTFIRKILLPLLAMMVLAAVALSRVCDVQATEAVDKGFKRALVTFAVARGLNGVISAAQGTEISVSPFGMGVTLAPGEILDPINDLVERFSGFMMVSAVALGSERVLIDIVSWTPLSIVLIVMGVCLILLRALGDETNPRWRRLLWRVFVVISIVRFVVPLSAIGSEWLYGNFLESRHAQAEAGITRATHQVQAINQEAAPPSTDRGRTPDADSKGSWRQLKEWADTTKTRAASAMDLSRYSNALEETAKDTIEVIAIFLLSTFVFPVSIAVGIWMFAKWLLWKPLTDGRTEP